MKETKKVITKAATKAAPKKDKAPVKAAPKAKPAKEEETAKRPIPKKLERKKPGIVEEKPAKPVKAGKKLPETAKPLKGKKAAQVSLGEEEAVEEDEDSEGEIEGLASIKTRFLKKGKQAGYIDQGDIMDATSHLDLTDEQFEELITYFKDNKIDVVSDEDEADDIDHIKVNEAEIAKAEKEVVEDEVETEDEAADTEKEEVASIEEFSKIPTGEVKVNDSVKMYLKEIGKVPLLTAKEETELAKRIAAGDKEAKDQLINANLRLVISIAKHYVGRGMARGGDLAAPMEVHDFARYAKEKLGVSYGLLIAAGKATVSSVAIIGGGGWFENELAQKCGYDIYISGDMPHHGRREVVLRHYNYLDLPHEIEHVFMAQMKKTLLLIDPTLEVVTIDHEKLPEVI